MFSVQQKREISDAVQKILRATNHPELPKTGEIEFMLRVEGAEEWSWAEIKNNEAVTQPSVNPWNEAQASHCINTAPPQCPGCGHIFYHDLPLGDGRCKYCHEEAEF